MTTTFYHPDQVLNNTKFHITSRGGHSNRHPGNKASRELLGQYVSIYVSTRKSDRGAIARQIYHQHLRDSRIFVIERDYFLRCYEKDLKTPRMGPERRRKLSIERVESVIQANGGSLANILALPAKVFIPIGEAFAIASVDHLLRGEVQRQRAAGGSPPRPQYHRNPPLLFAAAQTVGAPPAPALSRAAATKCQYPRPFAHVKSPRFLGRESFARVGGMEPSHSAPALQQMSSSHMMQEGVQQQRKIASTAVNEEDDKKFAALATAPRALERHVSMPSLPLPSYHSSATDFEPLEAFGRSAHPRRYSDEPGRTTMIDEYDIDLFSSISSSLFSAEESSSDEHVSTTGNEDDNEDQAILEELIRSEGLLLADLEVEGDLQRLFEPTPIREHGIPSSHASAQLMTQQLQGHDSSTGIGDASSSDSSILKRGFAAMSFDEDEEGEL